MRGNQYTAGLTYEPINGIEFSVEGYYKTIDNVIQKWSYIYGIR